MDKKCSNCGNKMSSAKGLFVLSNAQLNPSSGNIDIVQGSGVPVKYEICHSCGKIDLYHAIPQLLANPQ